ncbi:unnamed protein product [Camellia sinensis]
MRQRRSQTRQNFNKQEGEVRRERCPAQTSVTCDGSRRTPSFFALHACELELTREAPAAALDRSRSHRRRSRSFLQALVRRAPLRSPLCRRLAFHALCSSLRSSLRSLRHRRPRPRLAPGMHMLPKLLLYRFTFSSQCPGRRPTYEFPHPLARVPQSAGYWLSYIVVDLLIWWGIRGYINDFRKRNLKLAPIAYFSLYRGSVSHLPTAYMWSPHVMPKPSDWGPQVDVVGYCFLNLGSKYQPPEEFVQWIQKGPQPIYIGFGSMPLEDPKKTMDIILEALKNTGQRGIIFPEVSDSVFPLEDCPHDWLFPQCLAVLYMPGNTTQMHSFVMHFKVTDLCDRSLKGNGICPTTIVPFFGDQFFWGERIYEKGLGPAPIPISQLNVESLSDAVQFMLQPEVKSQAMEIAKSIENEDGVAAAVDAFHRHLPSELPLPRSFPQEDDQPNPLQWAV